jgi:hypothetical protein
MEPVIIGAFVGAGITLIASLLTTFLNNRLQIKRDKLQFERQSQEEIDKRWWERKLDAYIRIIEALYQLINYYDLTFSDFAGEIKLSEERKADLEKTFSFYNNEIKKAAKIGAFMISEHADKSLKDYFKNKREDENQDWWEKFNTAYTAADDCLKEMTICAKLDLKIQNSLSKNVA